MECEGKSARASAQCGGDQEIVFERRFHGCLMSKGKRLASTHREVKRKNVSMTKKMLVKCLSVGTVLFLVRISKHFSVSHESFSKDKP
jgi:hypothetical protein